MTSRRGKAAAREPEWSSGIGGRRAAARAKQGSAYSERRAEIISVAAQVFREKGYRGASLADVAERLDTDRASLYYYIGSKEEAFQEIVRAAAESNARQAEAIHASGQPAPEQIRRLITELMRSYADHPYLFVYVQEDLTRLGGDTSAWARDMRAINKRYDDAVVHIVQSGLEDGSLRAAGRSRLIANAIIGMVNWSHRWYRGTIPADEVARTFADVVLLGLESSAGPPPAGHGVQG